MLTELEQRIACAELQGWVRCSFTRTEMQEEAVWHLEGKGFELESDLPNYPHDLNAMHEVEKTLIGANGYSEYPEVLYQVVYKNVVDQPLELHFSIVHASASQRLEAYLKLKGKWQD